MRMARPHSCKTKKYRKIFFFSKSKVFIFHFNIDHAIELKFSGGVKIALTYLRKKLQPVQTRVNDGTEIRGQWTQHLKNYIFIFNSGTRRDIDSKIGTGACRLLFH